jgi:hypothetical protein
MKMVSKRTRWNENWMKERERACSGRSWVHAGLDEKEREVEQKRNKNRDTIVFLSSSSLIFIVIFLCFSRPSKKRVVMDPSARMAVLARQLGAGARQGEQEGEDKKERGETNAKHAFVVVVPPGSRPCHKQSHALSPVSISFPFRSSTTLFFACLNPSRHLIRVELFFWRKERF